LDSDEAIACAVPFSGALGIEGYAYQAHDRLPIEMDLLIDNGDIAVGQIPNIISVDFAEEFVTDECRRISNLNLQ